MSAISVKLWPGGGTATETFGNATEFLGIVDLNLV